MSTKTEYYTLDKRGEPVPAPDVLTWASWFEDSLYLRRVAREEIGKYVVSTVFLGINHAPVNHVLGEQPPVLWETMVFNQHESVDRERCSGSMEQAEAMHVRMVEKVKKIVTP